MILYYFFNKVIVKKLCKGTSIKSGRNVHGRICVIGRGGANKVLYKFIDFYRRLNMKGKVINIIYDPNRTARLALVLYVNSYCSFILLQKNVKINSVIYSGSIESDDIIQTGFSMPLKYMPLFSNISNIELKPFNGSQLCRAAGTSCMLVGKIDNKLGVLKLNSKWEVHVSLDCMSSYGSIAYKALNNLFIEKAGKNRAFGWKPKVRGVAKNPCDHPHGGGNGKKPKPKIPVNAWHTVFKWTHTKNTKLDNLKRRKFKKLNEN
jgi:large subunit ribosomal protein L2